MKVITDQDIDFLKFLGEQESQAIRSPSRYLKEVLRYDIERGKNGTPLPWSNTHAKIRFRPGEVTVWGGYSGHGKSLLINQFCAWTLKNKTWLIASFEMTPAATLFRMCRQTSGVRTPSRDWRKQFVNWLDERLYLYDQTNVVEWKRIVGMVCYAGSELMADHVVLDPLIKLGFKGSRETVAQQQAEMVERLSWAAKRYHTHIHLVHHMRKGEGTESEERMPGKHDFRGAAEITDLADNVIVVWRNKRKERLRDTNSPDFDDNVPDAFLSVVKQRHGDWEGRIGLWFERESTQYVARSDRRVMPFDLEDGL